MAAWWKGVSSRVRGLMAVAAGVIAIAVASTVVPIMSCEEEAEAGLGPTARLDREERRQKVNKDREEWRREWDRQERERDERWARMEAESDARQAAFDVLMAKQPPPSPRRKVRRFTWESPAETRGKLWNVPVEETIEALETALLRVCIAEADGNPQDCTAIWQVIKGNRRRECSRGMIRRITECEENGGETYLSAIRRHQRHVLGYIKLRNKRAVWISNLTPACEVPEGWLQSENRWDSQYGTKTCPQAVADVRRLLAGKLPESRPGHRVKWLPVRPVTWGGRCETKTGACDDHHACERVLARIPDTDTLNAFWCRVGSAGCRPDPEPICLAMGYRYEQVESRGRQVWKLVTPGEATTVTSVEPEASGDTMGAGEEGAEDGPRDREQGSGTPGQARSEVLVVQGAPGYPEG